MGKTKLFTALASAQEEVCIPNSQSMLVQELQYLLKYKNIGSHTIMYNITIFN